MKHRKNTQKEKKKENSISELWDNFKWSNIGIAVVPGERREQEKYLRNND